MATPKPNLGQRLFGKFLGSAVSNAAGYSVGAAVLPTLLPLTQDLANQTWALHPVRALSAGVAAEAVVRGYLPPAGGAEDASFTGFNGDRFDTLTLLASNPPTADTLLDLYRRGAIGEGVLDNGLAEAGYRPVWAERMKARVNVLATVTDLVRFAVREVFDPGQRQALDLDAEYPGAFTERARQLGIPEPLAREYWASHWQLPSYEQGADMFFRGAISADQFERLLRALDYAPTWREPLRTIARRIPTMPDMIRFAVREVYDPGSRQRLGLDAEYPAVFTSKAAQHGLAEQDARDYWAAHWRLPSALQGYRMLWRGEITEADLDELLKALDYPPRWREPLANIARLVPGRIDLKRMLRHDILTADQVEAGYRKLGYSATDAERMTRIAVAELSSSETASPWANRARGRLYTVTHNEYLAESIDGVKARAMLAQVGATAAERDTIIAIWDAERSINRLELTPAQIRKAYTKELYTREQALAELDERGMTADDAAVFLDS